MATGGRGDGLLTLESLGFRINSMHMSTLVLQGICRNKAGITMTAVLAGISLWKTLKLSLGLLIRYWAGSELV